MPPLVQVERPGFDCPLGMWEISNLVIVSRYASVTARATALHIRPHFPALLLTGVCRCWALVCPGIIR